MPLWPAFPKRPSLKSFIHASRLPFFLSFIKQTSISTFVKQLWGEHSDFLDRTWSSPHPTSKFWLQVLLALHFHTNPSNASKWQPRRPKSPRPRSRSASRLQTARCYRPTKNQAPLEPRCQPRIESQALLNLLSFTEQQLKSMSVRSIVWNLQRPWWLLRRVSFYQHGDYNLLTLFLDQYNRVPSVRIYLPILPSQTSKAYSHLQRYLPPPSFCNSYLWLRWSRGHLRVICERLQRQIYVWAFWRYTELEDIDARVR